MPKSFHIKAGPIAMEHIKRNGLTPEMINVIPAAAGGPKWIVLYAFDKYLMKNWFADQKTKLHLVGASAGAWRMMCYATSNPIDTLQRFLNSYVEQSYPEWPTPEQVSSKMKEILQFSLADGGISDILQATNRHLHIITSGTNFKIREGSNYKLQFGKIVLKNLVSRNWLKNDLQRVVFTNKKDSSTIFQLNDSINTRFESITKDTIMPALQATGTIPMLMNPVTEIAYPNTLLWDGALVDYHIALSYNTENLVLYPHFSDRIIPGWFDKFVPWRRPSEQVTDRMIMIHPSKSFIESLPDQKIPDRKDFETYFDQKDTRISNWYEVAKRGEEIVKEFDSLYQNGSLIDHLEIFG